MMDIVIGQRWISQTEHNLGLGIVTELSGRLITLDFPAAEEQRTYARDNAPISRVEYSEGDRISDINGQELEIIQILRDKGLTGYLCHDKDNNECVIPEVALNSHVNLTTPRQRLLSGQVDGNSAFRLRIQTLNNLDRLQRSAVTGLAGGRMELLPHQIYIAHEVSRRYAPRILLADEVGLGKTIEAGMVIHQQLLTHQAKRILILVPESLMHQWLVELLRRFNLFFSLYNKDRLASVIESGTESDSNPFDSDQLVISSLNIIQEQPGAVNALNESQWDMLVVDEAHHLEWTENKVSTEYQLVEQLAARTRSVLLLTATPEQVGSASHFARLRLLDPQRYDDLDVFLEEEQDYKALNQAMELLDQPRHLSATDLDPVYKELEPLIAATLFSKLSAIKADSVAALQQHLLDLHGTGRVLFRNQRSRIKGFPKREPKGYLLSVPSNWPKNSEHSLALYPEQLFSTEDWLVSDPRIDWLIQFLKQNKRNKVLVICHLDETAMQLDKFLNLRQGIRTTSFYPALSIIERDRAAAYFADMESGAQVLICSEIGSEGRNFQFANNLVLFDLPLNPDLLEQRIGRLDRIGQKENIQIHVPYLQNTAQETLYRWYDEGLDIFHQTTSAGFAIFRHFEQRLYHQLANPDDSLDSLIMDTKTYRIKLNHELQEGKDRLLERNSLDQNKAQALVAEIQHLSASEQLADYMTNLFNEYGVEADHHSDMSLVIRPSEQMREQHFPGLRDEGQTVTFSRERAIEREDFDFLTWEHPMVVESMEAIRFSELGNAAVATIEVKGLKPGTLLLESCFIMATSAPRHLQVERFLPLSPLRLLSDINGKELSHVVDHPSMNKLARRIPREVGRQAIQQLRSEIDQLITQASQLASARRDSFVQEALGRMDKLIDNEIKRMRLLAELNPNIREDELNHLQERKKGCTEAIENADMQLQAVRLLISG